MSLLLAIDGGSQSTKVTLVDAAGRVRGSGRAALRPYELGPDGRAVHPDDDLWDSLVTACRAALADRGGQGDEWADRVVAIGLCGIRFCRALLDDAGRLTEPVLSWMDDRVGRPLDPPGSAVATVTGAGGYLAVRLTGERRDSAAAYAGVWPLDPVTRRWSTDPAEVARTGMPVSLLPELVEPGDVLGLLTGDAARALGLPAGVPVVATANDKAVEALGAGVVEPGRLLLSLGTYVAAMTPLDPGAALTASDDRVWLNPAAVPGATLAESAGVRRGMSTVSWVRDLAVAGHDGPVDPDGVLRRLEDGARGVRPGCEGLLTIPDWLAPGRAPYRRGAVLGLTGAHGAPHLYRSVLEGLALTMRGHVDALEEALGRRAAEVVVAGGGARSPLMRQVVADVLGRPVSTPAVTDAAGTGAAICAAVGSGLHPSYAAAVEAMVQPGETVEPDPGRMRLYDELHATYATLPEHTDPLFRSLAARTAGAAGAAGP